MNKKILSLTITALFATPVGALFTVDTTHAQATQAPKKTESIVVTAAKEAEPTLNLSTIAETGSRLATSIKDTPVSIDAVDQATMQSRGKKTMVDALEGIAGITAAVRPGSSAAMQGRGFAENSFSILYDGIRVGSTNATMRVYDSFAFERLEVLRGAAGIIAGEGSVGGAINHVRKQPSRTAQPVDVLTSFSGSPNAFRVGLGTGGPLSDNVSGRIDAVSNVFRTDVQGTKHNSQNIVASLRWDVTANLSMIFGVDVLRNSIDNPYWGTPLINGRLDASLRNINYNNIDDNVHDDDVTWFTWKTNWQTGQWSLSNIAWHYQANRDWKNAYRFAFFPATATTGAQVRRQWFEDLAYDHEFFGSRAEAKWNGTLGAMPFKSAGGIEVGKTNFLSPRGATTGTSQFVDPINPVNVSFFSFNSAGRNRLVSVDQLQKSVFAEAQLTFAPTWNLIGGLRQDQLDFDYQDRRPTSFAEYTKDFRPVTGRIALLWNATPTGNAYIQYATGTESRFTAFFLSPTDIPFDLTRARQIEAGWKQSFANGKGEWTAAIYRLEKDKIPFADPVTNITSALGKQSARGLELSGAFRLSSAFALDGNIAIVDPQYDKFASGGVSFAGKTPPNVPKRVANLTATVTPMSGTQLMATLRHVGKFYANDANTIELPQATTLELAAMQRLTDKITAGLRVRNATDKFYASWATDANYVIVAPKRSIEMTIRASF